MEYFAQVKTVQGATKRYRALAKKWHPDRNGSIDAGAVMAEINRQYKEVIVALANEKASQDAANPHENHEKEPREHVTDMKTQAIPRRGPKEQPCNDPQPSRTKGAFAKSFVRSFVSDRDVDRLGEAAEELISNTAKTMIAKGISAFHRWKTVD